MDIVAQVKETIDDHKLLRKSERVIVGVSGGPDSVVLLYILNALRYELGITLHVAHLNHRLRKDAWLDQRFVEKLCDRWKLSLTARSLKKSDFQKNGSQEEIARDYRFQFFMDVAKKQDAKVIALGHTQDDLAETVLMRVIRGTGLMGMRGILPRRQINGFRFIRPLLDIPRLEIERFLKKEKLSFRIDSSNTDLKFFRNKIRRELIPNLEKSYNHRIKEVLAHLADVLAGDYDYLEEQSKKILTKLVASQSPVAIKLKLSLLQKTHRALQRMLIRLSIERLRGDLNQLTFGHLSEIEDLIQHRPTGSVVHLPGGLSASRDKNCLVFWGSRKGL